MSTVSRYTAQDIIDAYQRTGSVWRAGKELGLAGQTVHERLLAVGYPLAGRRWTGDEIDELRALAGHATIGEIARRLGRPYNGVACKISDLGIGSRAGNRRKVKIPRGAGYDKASVKKYMRQLDTSGDSIYRFARRNGLGIEALVQAIERDDPDWWRAYREAHSDLPAARCGYCDAEFIPSSAKQKFCSRKCGSDARTDESYFGGRRRQTIGLAEGKCQLCGRVGIKGLSSHHVLGKENDPDNEALVALCSGCHKAVTFLASRTFVDDEVAWQSLISLVWLRRHGHRRHETGGVEVCVDIDEISTAAAAEMAELDGEMVP